MIPSFLLGSLILLGPARPTLTLAADARNQEIRVNLFGQPCTMEGPFTKAQLTSLHEISPEKIPPAASVPQMKSIIAKTTQIKGLPLPVEQYRDHLRKRLSAKIALEEAIQSAKKAKAAESRKSLDALLKNLKEHVSSLQYPSFETGVRKLFESNAHHLTELFFEGLRERFEGVIQPDTEEEFHKAIRIAKIQYVCVFDDGEHSDENEASE